jgi:hypothetical protein
MWTSIILIFWFIWRHRNDMVFNGASPSQWSIRENIKVEYDRWRVSKLFCGALFSFPDLVDLPWQAGE